MAGKLFVKTHGCQMNEYDSAKMVDVLAQSHGLELTDKEDEADVILVNTCSIREKAQEKVFSQLGRWKQLKKKNDKVIIGVGGCVASQEGEAILKRAPFVDLVFGPQTLHRLPELIEAKRESGRPQVDISFPEIEKFDRLPEPRAEGPTAFVSVMEGCSKYCTFCVVPYTRGEEVSRPLADVLLEITQLAEKGVKEVTLLGQNVSRTATRPRPAKRPSTSMGSRWRTSPRSAATSATTRARSPRPARRAFTRCTPIARGHSSCTAVGPCWAARATVARWGSGSLALSTSSPKARSGIARRSRPPSSPRPR